MEGCNRAIMFYLCNRNYSFRWQKLNYVVLATASKVSSGKKIGIEWLAT